MAAPKIKPDPELERQQAAARQDKISAIQDSVSGATDALVRLYGSKSAMAGTSGSMKAPILGWGR